MLKHQLLLTNLTIVFLLLLHTSCTKNDPPIQQWKKEFGKQWKTMKGLNNGNSWQILHNLKTSTLSYKTQSTIFTSIENIGPSEDIGGRVRAIIIDINDTTHLISGAASGGIWQSFDNGESWFTVSDETANLNISCMSQALSLSSHIYAGTGEMFGSAEHIPGDGIYKSTDHGSTFSQLSATNSEEFSKIWDIEVSKTDQNTFYASCYHSNGGVFRSTNGGISLEKVFSTSDGNDLIDIDVFSSGAVLLAVGEQEDGTEKGLYYSTSGNVGTFEKLNTSNGLPEDSLITCFSPLIAKCAQQENVLYFINDFGIGINTMYKSIDFGQNWTEIYTPPFSVGYTSYMNLLEVNPNNPDELFIGGENLFFSNDGGTTWDEVTSSGHIDNHIIAFNPLNPNTLFIGNDGGIYKHKINMLENYPSNNNYGLSVVQFYAGDFFHTGKNILGGAQDHGVLIKHPSASPSFQFTYRAYGDGGYCAVHPIDSNVTYYTLIWGKLFRNDSTLLNGFNGLTNTSLILGEMDGNDNGTIDDLTWFINPFTINKHNGDYLFFPSQERLWLSTNRGENWHPITNIIGGFLAPDVFSVGLSNDDNPTVYIGGEEMLLYRIDNSLSAQAGDEVNLQSSVPTNLSGSFIANIKVSPSSHSTIYLSLSDYSNEPRAYKITNATTNAPIWTPIHGDLPTGLPVNCIEVNPSNEEILYAATDFGLYTSINGGINWAKETGVPNVYIPQIKYRFTDDKLFIFTHGRGAWVAQMNTDLTLIKNRQPPPKEKISLFPNPSTNKINIKSSTNHNLEPICIYDLNGALLINLENTKTQSIDISALPPGTYQIKLKLNDEYLFEKFVKN